MKKLLSILVIIGISILAMPISVSATTSPNWNVTGTYKWLVLGTYEHDMVISIQNPDGTFSGTGGYPAGSFPYTAAGQTAEVITGQVIGNQITFTTTYSGPYNPGYSVTVSGTIASGGTMSGTTPWEWHTTSGKAVLLGTLHAEDFGVVNYDVSSGLGTLKGYTAGFGLTDTTFAGAQSVVVKLYSGNKLLQTNTATAKFKTDITGTQFSSPFDIFGTFNYTADGYWTNVRKAEYGQTLRPTKVVATVVLANGKTVTAENTNPTGDPATIYPTTPPSGTPPSTTPTIKSQCKNSGWKSFSNPSFKNQGQCVSSVNGRAANHGQYVRSQENKKEAAQSTIGMPPQSKGHTK